MTPQLNDILKLSITERILLVEAIWDSIATHPDSIEISASHKNIIDSELAKYAANPNNGSSWEEVRSKIKLGKK